MQKPPRRTSAGILMALSLVAGVVGGILTRQPSAGFVAGLLAGIVLAGVAVAIEARK